MGLALSVHVLALSYALKRFMQMAEVIGGAGIECATRMGIDSDIANFMHSASSPTGVLSWHLWFECNETRKSAGIIRVQQAGVTVSLQLNDGSSEEFAMVILNGFVDGEGVWNWDYVYHANLNDPSHKFSEEIGRFLAEEMLQGDNGNLSEGRAPTLFQAMVRDFASRMPPKVPPSMPPHPDFCC